MGSRTIGSLLVKLGFDAKEVDQGLKKFERNLKQSARQMESIGRQMSIGFTAPFVLGIRQAIKAYDEEAQAVKKLEIALGSNTKALVDQAAAIQKATVYADDQVLTIQAWAAALGHSEGEVKAMTTAAVNLAAGLNIELSEAMKMLHQTTTGSARSLGKLLPEVKALTAEQLKSGDAIDIVTKKFAGFAEAAGNTGTGPLKKLQNQLGDISEDIGKIALPMVTKLAEKLKALAEWFDNLSPATKEFAVNFGAFLAMAGPVLIITSNIIKLTQALIALKGSMTAVAAVGGGVFAAGGAIAAAESWAYKRYNPLGSDFGKTVGSMVMSATGGQYQSSMINQNLGLIPGMPGAVNSGFLAPPAQRYRSTGGGGGGTSTGGGGGGTRNAADYLVPDNFGVPIGMEGLMMSSFSPSGFNPITEALPGIGIKGISGEFERALPVLENFKHGISSIKDTFISMGDIIGVVLGDVISNLEQGGKSFGEYALSAIAAITKVIQAKMMETVVSIVASGAKTGLAGALIGLAASTAILAGLKSAMESAQPPALAQGGLAYGPTMALVGDNQGASMGNPEVIAPLDKLKSIIGGGGGGRVEVVGMISGDNIRIVTAKSQDYAIRRGAANTIQF